MNENPNKGTNQDAGEDQHGHNDSSKGTWHETVKKVKKNNDTEIVQNGTNNGNIEKVQ